MKMRLLLFSVALMASPAFAAQTEFEDISMALVGLGIAQGTATACNTEDNGAADVALAFLHTVGSKDLLVKYTSSFRTGIGGGLEIRKNPDFPEICPEARRTIIEKSDNLKNFLRERTQ
jgi:hypothetical protein